MTTPQYFVAGIISTLALGLVILGFFHFPVDSTTLGLVGLAILPWLTLFFKKFKVPGIVEGEAQDRAQGVTPPTPPKLVVAINERTTPEADSSVRFKSLSPSAQKILRTLWRYQKQTFKGDYTRRWTFAILPTAPEYPKYLEGLSILLKTGLISMNPENHQAALTNEGIILMESLGDDDIKGDFYVF